MSEGRVTGGKKRRRHMLVYMGTVRGFVCFSVYLLLSLLLIFGYDLQYISLARGDSKIPTYRLRPRHRLDHHWMTSRGCLGHCVDQILNPNDTAEVRLMANRWVGSTRPRPRCNTWEGVSTPLHRLKSHPRPDFWTPNTFRARTSLPDSGVHVETLQCELGSPCTDIVM